ncbi:MAG: histidinol-phosphatase HisJ family protein [Erysipelotrichaceae bacterium]|nr:histidinol-phosphatase HisJ family protein [Erysipelotrichaceae bacterium]
MLADYHVHTAYSPDSTYPMEDVVKRAIELGLDELCFTDHSDYAMGANQVCDFPAYFRQIDELKQRYQGQIVLKTGAEFGMQTHTIQQFQDTFDQYPFDFVLLSCHQIDNREFSNQDFQQGKTQEEINSAYYQEIYEVMKQYKDYSVLGHLDAIKRDDPYGVYPFVHNKEIIEAILRLAIADGKGIEVNTSSFRYHLPDLTPCRDILRLYL